MIDEVKETTSSILRQNSTHQKLKGKYIFQKQISNDISPQNTSQNFNTSSTSSFRKKKFFYSFQKTANVHEGASRGLYNNDSVWNQSAMGWQQSSLSYAFGKEERFNLKKMQKSKPLLISKSGEFDLKSLPNSLSHKACSFGKGQKQMLYPYQIKNALENPPPGYLDNIYNSPKSVKNITMGTANRFYLPQKQTPGPGSYQVQKSPGEDKKKFVLKSRVNQDKCQFVNQLAPSHYSPQEELIKNQKFKKISFGKGNRKSFQIKSMLNNPGPIYRIPSPFDKYSKATKNWVSPLSKCSTQNRFFTSASQHNNNNYNYNNNINNGSYFNFQTTPDEFQKSDNYYKKSPKNSIHDNNNINNKQSPQKKNLNGNKGNFQKDHRRYVSVLESKQAWK
ncbi:hypothetical protein PPERSA_07048 [Pseudocohnilembus persalinus]|uniref:Sperm-tail PG-rich repeat n=1 Tax=Pseudocohnilembus persalinus TaxID=266149 RepID=A0A0V0QAK8_PSEPJ|nr:hypothetical protein PPERSA_07048 [Pseudocohnilembus persalinus]|eukprot:KRW99276.1 hypothetical protein PPERSA_07048 [Pseudocohnilembus persalinus]